MTSNSPIRRPMKAGDYIPEYHKPYFPYVVQPKFDGWRCVMIKGVAYTNTMKPFRNTDIQAWAQKHADFLNGCDGEMIYGEDISEKNFRASASMCSNSAGGPNFTFWVFDLCSPQHRLRPYIDRLRMVEAGLEAWKQMEPSDNRLRIAPYIIAKTPEEMVAEEEKWLSLGCEGVMLHHPSHPYKDGRSTEKEGYLLKVKRFEDKEATITAWYPLLRNRNEAFIDETGMQKRSVHQANLVAENLVGSLDIQFDDGSTTSVGSGLDDSMRYYLYQKRNQLVGKRVTVKLPGSQGGYDSYRQPIFKALRDPLDGG